MNSKELNKRLKENITDNLYLFCGDEDYIKETSVKRIKSVILANDFSGMNFIQYDEIPEKNELHDVVESVPLMSDKKLILFNSLGLLSSSLKKDVKDMMTGILSDIPEYTVIIIKEAAGITKYKTSPIYKLADKQGIVVECDLLSASDLMTFAARAFKSNGKIIEKNDLQYLLSLCNGDLNSVITNVDKICSYLGDNTEVKKATIDILVKKNIEDRVYELFDAIINGRKKEAFQILSDLKLLKNQHPAGQLFSIICDNFINIYISVNNSKDGITSQESRELLGLAPNRAFLIGKYIQYGRKTELSRFRRIITTLAEMDYKVKNGLMDPYFAIEEIIAVF